MRWKVGSVLAFAGALFLALPAWAQVSWTVADDGTGGTVNRLQSGEVAYAVFAATGVSFILNVSPASVTQVSNPDDGLTATVQECNSTSDCTDAVDELTITDSPQQFTGSHLRINVTGGTGVVKVKGAQAGVGGGGGGGDMAFCAGTEAALVNGELFAWDDGSSCVDGTGVPSLSGATDPNAAPTNCTAVGQIYTHSTYGIKFDCIDSTADMWIPRGQQIITSWGSINWDARAADTGAAGESCLHTIHRDENAIGSALEAVADLDCPYVSETQIYLTGMQVQAYSSSGSQGNAANLDVGECVITLGSDAILQTNDPPSGGTLAYALPFTDTIWSGDLATLDGGSPLTGENEATYIDGQNAGWTTRVHANGLLALHIVSADIDGDFYGCDLGPNVWTLYGIFLPGL